MRQIVTLNGAKYDALTGERIDDKPGFVRVEDDRGHTVKKTVNPARSVHGTTQRSQTLNRKSTQKPASHVVQTYRKERVSPSVQKVQLSQNLHHTQWSPLYLVQLLATSVDQKLRQHLSNQHQLIFPRLSTSRKPNRTQRQVSLRLSKIKPSTMPCSSQLQKQRALAQRPRKSI